MASFSYNTAAELFPAAIRKKKRAGFAYRLGSKMVVRGGVGVYHTPLTSAGRRLLTGPFSATQNFPAVQPGPNDQPVLGMATPYQVAGLGSALVSLPGLLPLFRWAGAAWLVWLAWQIANAPAPGDGGRTRVLGFAGAMAFQWINPKAWLIAVGAAGEYLSPHQPLIAQLTRIFIVFLAVGMPCVLVWALLASVGMWWPCPLRRCPQPRRGSTGAPDPASRCSARYASPR